MMKILLVEDNTTIIKGLEYAFTTSGYEFVAKSTVYGAKTFLAGETPDLIILDITLPDGNGLKLYETNIRNIQIPTIFLTAQDDEETVVEGLDLGAEDYITKPFSTRELLARVNRILLRNRKKTVLSANGIAFDMERMIVTKGQENISLSSLELKILHLFFLNLGKVVSRNTILDKIWEWTGNDVDDHTVTVYLKRIREKIGNDVIVTVKGIGYRIDEDEK